MKETERREMKFGAALKNKGTCNVLVQAEAAIGKC